MGVIHSLTTLLSIIGAVVQVNASDDSISDYDSYDFRSDVGAITRLTSIEHKGGDDIIGYHFLATPNFARKAAQSFLLNVDENTPASGGPSATYDAQYRAGHGSRHLNLAPASVGGTSFFLRLGPDNIVYIHLDERAST